MARKIPISISIPKIIARKKSTPAPLKGPEVSLKDLEEGELSSSLDLSLSGSERSHLRPVRCSERSILREIQSIRSLILDLRADLLILDLRADLAHVKGGTKVEVEDQKSLKIARCGVIWMSILLVIILFVLILIFSRM